MTTLVFLVRAHTEFRVGATYARDGVDAAVDHDDPLPADHLKGVMRAAAGHLLGGKHPLVRSVFGSTGQPSPWAWTSAAPADGAWTFSHRHRVAIDDATHAATKDLLVLGEQVWIRSDGDPSLAGTARFDVRRTRPVPPPDNPADTYGEDAHVTLLRCAAAGVHALGAWRRRGLGWVQISPDPEQVTHDEVRRLVTWREEAR